MLTVAEQDSPGRIISLPFALLIGYAVLVVTVLVRVLVALHGGFSYSLDDPYIHLALAQQIAHGHYGINPGEASSPASSIVWPFLLVPFSWAPFRLWAPLGLNLAFGAAECVLLDADYWSDPAF